MSVDAQERVDPVRQRRTDDAMHIAEPVQNPRVGPRVIPIVVTVVVAAIIIALLFVAPWG